MKNHTKRKKSVKIFLFLILLVLIFKFVYPYLNRIEITDDGILIDESKYNLNTEEDKNTTYDDVSSILKNNDTILNRLNSLTAEDKRIDEIMGNYDNYPEELLVLFFLFKLVLNKKAITLLTIVCKIIA